MWESTECARAVGNLDWGGLRDNGDAMKSPDIGDTSTESLSTTEYARDMKTGCEDAGQAWGVGVESRWVESVWEGCLLEVCPP